MVNPDSAGIKNSPYLYSVFIATPQITDVVLRVAYFSSKDEQQGNQVWGMFKSSFTATSASTLISTETALPEPASTPSIVLTATVISIPLSELLLPQVWQGTYKFNSVDCGISVIIEEISGDTFTGRQVDAACDGYQEGTAIINGQFIRSEADFVAELEKWGNLEGYETGPKNGLWLKWTGTYVVGGTQSSYYYAHIREDKTMLSIRYYTEDVASLVEETLFFQLK